MIPPAVPPKRNGRRFFGGEKMNFGADTWWIVATVWAIVVGVLAYFLKRTINKQDRHEEDISHIKLTYVTRDQLKEFKEETNLSIDEELKYLGSKKVSHRKLVIIFYTLKDFDLSKCKSNTFRLECPRGSGKYNDFPEMDKYEWMDISKAKKMVLANQLYFICKLEDKLNEY